MEITYQIGDHVKMIFKPFDQISWIITEFIGKDTVRLRNLKDKSCCINTRLDSIAPDIDKEATIEAEKRSILGEEEDNEFCTVRDYLYKYGWSIVKTTDGINVFRIAPEDYPEDDPRYKPLTKEEIKKKLNDTFGVASSINKPIDSEDITALCQNLELLRRDISSLRYTLQERENLGEDIRNMDHSICYLNATLMDSLDFAKECEKKDRELRDISKKLDEACKDNSPALVPKFKLGEMVYQGKGKTKYEILDMRLVTDHFDYLVGGKAHSNHWVNENKLHY